MPKSPMLWHFMATWARLQYDFIPRARLTIHNQEVTAWWSTPYPRGLSIAWARLYDLGITPLPTGV